MPGKAGKSIGSKRFILRFICFRKRTFTTQQCTANCRVTVRGIRLRSHRSIRYSVFAIRYSLFAIRYTLYGHDCGILARNFQGGMFDLHPICMDKMNEKENELQDRKLRTCQCHTYEKYVDIGAATSKQNGIRCTKIEHARFPVYYTKRRYTEFRIVHSGVTRSIEILMFDFNYSRAL